MGQSLWQLSSTFDLLHSFHKWIQSILSCGNTAQKIQIMTVSRFWHCRKSERFEIDFRWNIVRIQNSHVCYNKLDMQQTEMCVTRFNGFWNYFSGYRFTHGRNSRPRSLGFGYYCDALKLKSGAEWQASTKKSGARQSIREATNSTSHQTGTTRTFFSWALRMTQVISLVHKTVILSSRCHVTPWYWWACFLVFLLHISFLFDFLFIRSRIESNSHCRSTHRRVRLIDWISNTNYQSNIDLNYETDSTTTFGQKDNYQERVSLSVSEQIQHQKSRSSNRKSAASTKPTIFGSNRKCFWQRERDNVLKTSVFSHSIRSRKLESRSVSVLNESLTRKRDRTESINQSMTDRKQERGHPGSTKTQKKSALCFNDEHMSLENCWVEIETSEVQRTCGTPW